MKVYGHPRRNFQPPYTITAHPPKPEKTALSISVGGSVVFQTGPETRPFPELSQLLSEVKILDPYS